MFPLKLSKLFALRPSGPYKVCVKQCHGVLGIKKLIRREKVTTLPSPPFLPGYPYKLDKSLKHQNVDEQPLPKNYEIQMLKVEDHEKAIKLLKEYYFPHHVLVQARKMDLTDDRAIDEYIEGIFKQGNSLCLRAENGEMVGLCVNHAVSPVDPNSLRNYAFYRQNPNTKDFLYFTAKLQETPNLWNLFKEPKIFEMKMLTVMPEHRRQGLAVMMTERAKELADDQGYSVMRMNCINPYDYKIAERCMLQCLTVFPIHRLRGPNAPFVKKSSDHNRCLRVYVKCPKTCPRLDEKQLMIE